ncbi:MAG: hypothetical protein GC185_02350 [Alphaproteobacteria bacterium]|nr:hypothetical protein [Alphaproteobacteria bacterium]
MAVAALGGGNLAFAQTTTTVVPAKVEQLDKAPKTVVMPPVIDWKVKTPADATTVTPPSGDKLALAGPFNRITIKDATADKFDLGKEIRAQKDRDGWRSAHMDAAFANMDWAKPHPLRIKPEINVWQSDNSHVTLRPKHGGVMLQFKIKTR